MEMGKGGLSGTTAPHEPSPETEPRVMAAVTAPQQQQPPPTKPPQLTPICRRCSSRMSRCTLCGARAASCSTPRCAAAGSLVAVWTAAAG